MEVDDLSGYPLPGRLGKVNGPFPKTGVGNMWGWKLETFMGPLRSDQKWRRGYSVSRDRSVAISGSFGEAVEWKAFGDVSDER